jgi:hypothetical protein
MGIGFLGVPKHSDFEPDYFLAKGNGNPPQTTGLMSLVGRWLWENESEPIIP